jgi:hypothetical protein
MAEIWGAAIAVGGSLIAGYANKKSADKAADRAESSARAATRDEALYSGLLSQFQNEEEYRFQQLNRQNKERGLAEFRKFNNMQAISPNYQQDINTGIKVPDKQNIAAMLPAEKQAEGKKKRSLLDKLGNPAGL